MALDGIDLEVAPGEFFGLLGPNGAGKTTLIKILTTLLLPTSGTAQRLRLRRGRQTMEIRRIMNIVSGGEQSGYGLLTVREQLWMMSQFYGLGTREGWKRVDELIEAVGLTEQTHQKISQLSTGQRQKLNLARGLLNDPVDLLPRRADARAGRLRGSRRARPGARLARRGTRPDGPAHLPLHGRGRGAVRAAGDRGPRPDSRDRQSRRAQASRPARVDLPARARPPRRRPVLAGRAPRRAQRHRPVTHRCRRRRPIASRSWSTWSSRRRGTGSGRLCARGLGAHIVSLQKSEPSLEDVFVELVGRGFEDENVGSDAPGGSGTASGNGTGRHADATARLPANRCRPKPSA